MTIPSQSVVDFKTSGYFSWPIIFLGILLALVGLAVLLKNTIVGLILFFVSTIIFTTHYRLRIDFDTHLYQDYLWILGLKNGNKRKFQTIEYLFIQKNKVGQTMNHMVASTTIRKEVYDGYLKFSDQDKIHVTTKDRKKDLIDKLRVISAELKIKIIDYSEGAPKEI